MGAASAAEERYVALGRPCRAKQVLDGTAVRDRTTGREVLALANMNEVSGCELILPDWEHDHGRVFHAPAGAGSWNVREVPGDRLATWPKTVGDIAVNQDGVVFAACGPDVYQGKSASRLPPATIPASP